MAFAIRCRNPPPPAPSAYQSNLFRSYHKFKNKFWSNFMFRISTKHQLQNLNQTSASRLNLKFKILTKPRIRILTKIQVHNLYKTSAAKYWPNFSFKILTKPCAQSLNKRKALWPNLSFQICNKLLPTRSSSLSSATVTVLVGIFTRHSHINQVY